MKKFFKNIWGWIINLWKIMIGFLSPVLRMAEKVFKKVFGTVVVLSFLVIPFLNNVIDHTTAHWLWYLALTFIILSLIMDWFHKPKPVFDSPIVEFARKWGEALAVFAMISVFVFNYYDIDKKWLWVIFVYMAIYTPCFFLSLLVFDVKQNGKDVEKHQKALINVFKNILLYWLVDLFYMCVFNYWIIYIENKTYNSTLLGFQFFFGILSLIIISFNLTNAFLNGAKDLRIFIALEFVVALIVCGYLIFIIPNCNIQKIVLTIVSALIGGILTLVGVAWTIKDTNEKRQEDLLRIEDERKEEERKKNIPYLMLANGSVTPNIARITETNNLNFSKATDVSKIKDGTYYVIKIDPFNVKNVSQSNAILKGIFLDEVYHKFAHNILIEKDGLCQVQIGINHWFAFPRKITSVRLLITDTLFNEYTIECEMYKKQDDKPKKDIAPNGIEYTVCFYNYIAETVLLPEYKTEEEFDE